MTRRSAVTLIEVLVTMFIMAIGMLALLVLFPLGAVSMGHALKDDRCASTAAMAENVAIAWDVRHNNMAAFGATGLVYFDPIGTTNGLSTPLGILLPGSPGIPRSGTTFATTSQLADRWFSLPDDITFMENGLANTVITGGIVDRGRRYSYAYLAKSLLIPTASDLVQLYVVVYSGRAVGDLTAEATYTASGTAGTNGILVNAWPTTIKRGGWILDPNNGYFYRVTNYAQAGGATTVEVQQNLFANVGSVVVMDNVAEVFDKGTSWRP